MQEVNTLDNVSAVVGLIYGFPFKRIASSGPILHHLRPQVRRGATDGRRRVTPAYMLHKVPIEQLL